MTFYAFDLQSAVWGWYDGNWCLVSTDCPTRHLVHETPFAEPEFLCEEAERLSSFSPLPHSYTFYLEMFVLAGLSHLPHLAHFITLSVAHVLNVYFVS